MGNLAGGWLSTFRRRRLARLVLRNLRWVAETRSTSPVWTEPDQSGAGGEPGADQPRRRGRPGRQPRRRGRPGR
jgi:hypothetical protein